MHQRKTTEESGAKKADNPVPTDKERRLWEQLRLKYKLDNEICQLKKELDANKRDKRNMGSEPLSNELQEMITKVTHCAC